MNVLSSKGTSCEWLHSLESVTIEDKLVCSTPKPMQDLNLTGVFFSFLRKYQKNMLTGDLVILSPPIRLSYCLSILPKLAHWKLHFAQRRIQIYTLTVYSSWSTGAKIGIGDIYIMLFNTSSSFVHIVSFKVELYAIPQRMFKQHYFHDC
jgi:hypothetical protein